jgi:hypothetical protein
VQPIDYQHGSSPIVNEAMSASGHKRTCSASPTTLTLNTESTYDWTAQEWNVPINLVVSHVYNFGSQPVSLGVGGRAYADSPSGGPDWGLRAFATFLFPTGG